MEWRAWQDMGMIEIDGQAARLVPECTWTPQVPLHRMNDPTCKQDLCHLFVRFSWQSGLVAARTVAS